MTISPEYAEELGRQIDELEAENERLRARLSAETAPVIKAAIRKHFKSIGTSSVVSSDGIERVYYSGFSLDKLADAVAAGLATQPPVETDVMGRSVMQRFLAAAGWDAGSLRHKQLEDALDGAHLQIVPKGHPRLFAGAGGLTPDLMNATTVSCTGLEITIACNDHDTKDALLDVLVDAAYTSAQPHNALAMTDDQLFDIAVKAWESQTSHEWYTDALEAVISAVRDALASH